jgi:hypothetical protein
MELAAGRRELLKYLIEFLSLVASRSEYNRMVPSSLATLFAPILVRTEVQQPAEIFLVHSPKLTPLVEQLIVDKDIIFASGQ